MTIHVVLSQLCIVYGDQIGLAYGSYHGGIAKFAWCYILIAVASYQAWRWSCMIVGPYQMIATYIVNGDTDQGI